MYIFIFPFCICKKKKKTIILVFHTLWEYKGVGLFAIYVKNVRQTKKQVLIWLLETIKDICTGEGLSSNGHCECFGERTQTVQRMETERVGRRSEEWESTSPTEFDHFPDTTTDMYRFNQCIFCKLGTHIWRDTVY